MFVPPRRDDILSAEGSVSLRGGKRFLPRWEKFFYKGFWIFQAFFRSSSCRLSIFFVSRNS